MTKTHIALPTREDETGVLVCYRCIGEMKPTTVDQTFTLNGQEIIISGIKAHKCAECGEIVYSGEEAKRIEAALLPYAPKS